MTYLVIINVIVLLLVGLFDVAAARIFADAFWPLLIITIMALLGLVAFNLFAWWFLSHTDIG